MVCLNEQLVMLAVNLHGDAGLTNFIRKLWISESSLVHAGAVKTVRPRYVYQQRKPITCSVLYCLVDVERHETSLGPRRATASLGTT